MSKNGFRLCTNTFFNVETNPSVFTHGPHSDGKSEMQRRYIIYSTLINNFFDRDEYLWLSFQKVDEIPIWTRMIFVFKEFNTIVAYADLTILTAF